MLPGDWLIEVKEIRHFYDGQKFTVENPDGEKCEYEHPQTYAEYYDVWENYHYFGLHNGGGPAKELPWTIDFLKYFDKVFQGIEIYRQKRGA